MSQSQYPGIPMTAPDHLEVTASETLEDSKSLEYGLSTRERSRSPHPYSYSSGTQEAYQSTTSNKSANARESHVPVDFSSESGTEADNESGVFFRGLPAPPERPHKGLRVSDAQDEGISPLVTPKFLQEENRSLSEEGLRRKRQDARKEKAAADAESKLLREKYTKRKRGEIARRTVEVCLLVFVAFLVCQEKGLVPLLDWWQACSYAVLLFRKRYLFRRREVPDISVAQLSFHYPSSFDPAPLLYPVFLPLLIAVSLFDHTTSLLLPNAILGIASLPAQCIPFYDLGYPLSLVHWAAAALLVAATQNSFLENFPNKPLSLKTDPDSILVPDVLVSMYPFHVALTATLRSVTTSSLDPAEIQLLSTALINLYLFAHSPQMEILKSLLWIGATFTFILCQHVLSWELALARLPSWRFRKSKYRHGPSQSFSPSILWSKIRRFIQREDKSCSDSDSPTIHPRSARNLHRDHTLTLDTTRGFALGESEDGPPSATGPLTKFQTHQIENGSPIQTSLHRRRHTLGDFGTPTSSQGGGGKRTTPSGRPKRSFTPKSRSFFSLTAEQAMLRRRMYAFYIYAMLVCIILGPVRTYVEQKALLGAEPFGWALGYLFGNISDFRVWVVKNDLEGWIALPPHSYGTRQQELPWAETFRQHSLGLANTRLFLFSYWIVLLIVGIGIVSQLSSVVEVDTRRKVFHGLIVAMILPTVPVDPCFIALALSLVLAVFLLLDLLRACQVPPVASPLTRFLAPYVDGRDHRGPVIVSHIFLLIGCSIPLWLSLAGIPRGGSGPWQGWELSVRDVSMVSGVICVGMGDAAASLIGRRYGRHKWYWGGGKSIEGSVAFAVAVTIGLLLAKEWLKVGGWVESQETSVNLGRIILAASGASVTEAVLTGANDNVVVPLVLWLLVRGLRI
ncbi:MAG: hypothetical protein Q9227_000741 [Pyrenula ochraceoflavens]